jgi:hypothetical protein
MDTGKQSTAKALACVAMAVVHRWTAVQEYVVQNVLIVSLNQSKLLYIDQVDRSRTALKGIHRFNPLRFAASLVKLFFTFHAAHAAVGY